MRLDMARIKCLRVRQEMEIKHYISQNWNWTIGKHICFCNFLKKTCGHQILTCGNEIANREENSLHPFLGSVRMRNEKKSKNFRINSNFYFVRVLLSFPYEANNFPTWKINCFHFLINGVISCGLFFGYFQSSLGWQWSPFILFILFVSTINHHWSYFWKLGDNCLQLLPLPSAEMMKAFTWRLSVC